MWFCLLLLALLIVSEARYSDSSTFNTITACQSRLAVTIFGIGQDYNALDARETCIPYAAQRDYICTGEAGVRSFAALEFNLHGRRNLENAFFYLNKDHFREMCRNLISTGVWKCVESCASSKPLYMGHLVEVEGTSGTIMKKFPSTISNWTARSHLRWHFSKSQAECCYLGTEDLWEARDAHFLYGPVIRIRGTSGPLRQRFRSHIVHFWDIASKTNKTIQAICSKYCYRAAVRNRRQRASFTHSQHAYQ